MSSFLPPSPPFPTSGNTRRVVDSSSSSSSPHRCERDGVHRSGTTGGSGMECIGVGRRVESTGVGRTSSGLPVSTVSVSPVPARQSLRLKTFRRRRGGQSRPRRGPTYLRHRVVTDPTLGSSVPNTTSFVKNTRVTLRGRRRDLPRLDLEVSPVSSPLFPSEFGHATPQRSVLGHTGPDRPPVRGPSDEGEIFWKVKVRTQGGRSYIRGTPVSEIQKSVQ